MKGDAMYRRIVEWMDRPIAAVFIIFWLCSPATWAAAADGQLCAAIEDPTERLACYDRWFKATPTQGTATQEESSESPLKERIAKEKLSTLGEFIILPHRPTYIMPITYITNVNTETLRPAFGDKADDIQKVEAKFQLSFKVPLWQNIAGKDIGLWFAYTQLSLWQLINSKVSSPFRETNYEPELAFVFGTNNKVLGMNNTLITVGFNHQSNGQTDPLSRSWNRIYANFVLERKRVVLSIKPWYRIPESKKSDDNPDIEDYLGYGEVSLFYKYKKRMTSLRLWNNLAWDNNRTSMQLDWSFPIAAGFKGYIQYFNGYGETLLDYNFRTNRLGLGIMLTDWF
jgi:phospholipase A1